MRLLAGLLAVLVASAAAADRSRAARAEFMRANPCPLTEAKRGACPGYEVDHVVPLCAGGADHPSNMQWKTREQHAAKTRLDVMRCRQRRSN